MRIILDVGSTHGGSIKKVEEAIRFVASIGITDVKFQILEKCHIKAGNTPIPSSWLKRFIDLGRDVGINVFASVWSFDGMTQLKDAGATTVKFAYSAHSNTSLINLAKLTFDEVIVSTDVMSYVPGVKNLFCIPQYPVYQLLSFECLFEKFVGFSDHTLGISQSLSAVRAGAKMIEKHVNVNESFDCPDSRFALTINQVEELKNAIDYTEMGV